MTGCSRLFDDVTRFLRPLLLLMAVVGLFGQSTAMAMSPVQSDGKSMAAMDTMECCDGMPSGNMHGKTPCKKITLQCIAAMGCPAAAITEPVAITPSTRQLDHLAPSWPLTARLDGRTYGPEPDPPSRLI
ncbi:MAG: hypothetical protein M3Y22_11760 [Pseudomonadota bacterium]|jgi:hypothetical protein|nr:hypothetical protein [Pseudomonadota bacterium]